MNTGKIQISKPEFVIKTHNQNDTKVTIDNRYASCVIVVLCGKMEFFFRDYSVILSDNDAIYIPEHTSYSIVFYETSDSVVINFHTMNTDRTAMPLKKMDRKTAEGYYDQLNTLLLKEEENYHIILSTYYALLCPFFDNKAPVSASEAYVIKAEAMILNELSTPGLCCNDLAKRLNISEVYLRKLFIKHRNMTISKFLLKSRMHHAQHLILEGCSISEAAVSVGYCDIYQFSRAYKKYYGFSPKKTK